MNVAGIAEAETICKWNLFADKAKQTIGNPIILF